MAPSDGILSQKSSVTGINGDPFTADRELPGTARIGVVTVTYNSEVVLEDFLNSLDGQTHREFLLYAIDNASQDRTVAMLEDWGDPRLRLIANTANVGIAEGNNQGARAARADGCAYVLLLNNDVKFAPETFARLVSEIEARHCDMLGPKILYADGVRIWAAGGGFQRMKGYLGFHYGEGEVDRGQYDQARRVEHCPACCLLVRVSVFDRIGMIDPKYFVYWDDSDFSYRAMRAGVTMFYTPRAVILHKVSTLTGGARSTFTTRYNVRGHIYFMLKSLGIIRCLFFLPMWQVHLFYKALRRKVGLREYLLRQRAFFEGIALWTS